MRKHASPPTRWSAFMEIWHERIDRSEPSVAAQWRNHYYPAKNGRGGGYRISARYRNK